MLKANMKISGIMTTWNIDKLSGMVTSANQKRNQNPETKMKWRTRKLKFPESGLDTWRV